MRKPPKGAQTEKERRRLRLGEALRENLARRRAQAKKRVAARQVQAPDRSHDSAGFGDDKQGG